MLEKIDEKGNVYTIPCEGVLMESGIRLNDGTMMTEGRVVELARELKEKLRNKDWHGFMELVPGSDSHLTEDEYYLLFGTIISERGQTVREALFDVADIINP